MATRHMVVAAHLLASTFALGAAHGGKFPIIRDVFGMTTSGEQVEGFTLTNSHGIKVRLMTYGATVVNLYTPDRSGNFGDIVLGFDTLRPYEDKSPYFGATIGRFANRIAKGEFKLDGQEYHVPINNGPNSLHGGTKGYDKRIWRGTAQVTKDGPSVTFQLKDPDGEQGYPGTVNVSVVYTLTELDTLRVEFNAISDKATPINLTNHSYFNLSDAGAGNIDGYRLKINASRYTPVDDNLIPTGAIASVADTPYDFRKSKQIGRDLPLTTGKPKGYDLNYVLDHNQKLRKVAEVFDPFSGRKLEVSTTQPGIQFYSGNQLDGSITGKKGIKYGQYCAFALEPQHFPDSPNHANFPSTILPAGKIYKETIEYRFSTVGSPPTPAKKAAPKEDPTTFSG